MCAENLLVGKTERGPASLSALTHCYNPCPREKHAESGWDSSGVEDAARSSAERTGAAERSSEGLGKPRESERKVEASAGRQEAEDYVSGCPQENRGGSARTLGEVEGRTAKEVTEIGPHFPQFHSQIFVFLPRIALTAIKQLFSLAGVDG